MLLSNVKIAYIQLLQLQLDGALIWSVLVKCVITGRFGLIHPFLVAIFKLKI